MSQNRWISQSERSELIFLISASRFLEDTGSGLCKRPKPSMLDVSPKLRPQCSAFWRRAIAQLRARSRRPWSALDSSIGRLLAERFGGFWIQQLVLRRKGPRFHAASLAASHLYAISWNHCGANATFPAGTPGFLTLPLGYPYLTLCLVKPRVGLCHCPAVFASRENWRPHGDSNPGSHRERVVS